VKVGDLVRHPAGMANVDEAQYRCGLVMDVQDCGRDSAGIQRWSALVQWLADRSSHEYGYDTVHLEVISASR
jgi:hypothetical protein